MTDKNSYDAMIDKLINIEDKFFEIKPIVKIIDMWVREKDYELIPVVNMLNDKIDDMTKAFGK